MHDATEPAQSPASSAGLVYPPNEQRVERFLRLHFGSEHSHGLNDLSQTTLDEKGKLDKDKRCRTLKGPATVEHALAHLSGDLTKGLGVAPLKSDSTCVEGLIDVDEYGVPPAARAEFLAKVEGLNALRPAQKLVVTLSKSAGLHLRLFLAEPTPAFKVRAYLKDVAAQLGLPPDVEVFPKCDEFGNANEVGERDCPGNWVNCPYHGAERPAVVLNAGQAMKLTLDEYLDLAGRFKANNYLLEGPRPAARDAVKEKRDYQRGSGDGNRYNYVKSDVGAYLRLHPEQTAEQLCEYAEKMIRPKLNPLVTAHEWNEWDVTRLCRKLVNKQAAGGDAGGSRKKPDKDDLILRSAAEVLGSSNLAVDSIERPHVWFKNGWLECKSQLDEKLIDVFADVNLAAGKGDVEKFHMQIVRSSTPRFLAEPPVDRVHLANGILSIDDQTIAEATPEFLWPNKFSTPWVADALCPKTEKMLLNVLGPEEVEAAFEMIGLVLVPYLGFQKAFLLVGAGNDGKSTVLKILYKILGPENYSSVTLHAMNADKFATSAMVGKLANVEADLSTTRIDMSGPFKNITGGDVMAVQEKYQKSFNVKIFARCVISSNWYPRCSDNSKGWFRRWHIIPFDRPFEDERDPRWLAPEVIEATFDEEMPGILRRSITAYRAARVRNSLTQSAAMKASLEKFKALTDSVSMWMQERCVIAAAADTTISHLRTLYNDFCVEGGYPPLDANAFTERVLAFGKGRVTTYVGHSNVRHFKGIGLRAKEEPPNGNQTTFC